MEQVWLFGVMVVWVGVVDPSSPLFWEPSVFIVCWGDAVWSPFGTSLKYVLPLHSCPLTSFWVPLVLEWFALELWQNSELALAVVLHSLVVSVHLTFDALTSAMSSITVFCCCSDTEVFPVVVELGFRCCFSSSLHGRCFVRHILWLKVLLQVSHLYGL